MALLLSLLATATLAAAHAEPALRWSLFDDTSGRLALDDVRKAPFRPLASASFSRPPSPGALWLHVSLPPLDAPRWLWLLAPKAQEIDYFLFERGEPGLVEVFDDFDQGRGVEPGEAAVAVGEARLDQSDSFALTIRQVVDVNAVGGSLEHSCRHVGTSHVCDLRNLQERLDETSLPAPQVEHP